MRKTVKHTVYTIKEKNAIVEEYLRGETGREAIKRKYDISSDSVFHRWITQYREFGTTYDKRGKSINGKTGRKKKIIPEEMSREDLIQYVNAVEDIKKFMAYLNKQRTNTK